MNTRYINLCIKLSILLLYHIIPIHAISLHNTVLQNWKSVQLKCGVLGCCLPLLVHQYHASTSEIEIISIGIHDLAASQHQFLDVTKCFVSSKNWCWLAAKSWIPIDMISISLVKAWYWCTKIVTQCLNTPHFSLTLFQFWSTVLKNMHLGVFGSTLAKKPTDLSLLYSTFLVNS